MMERPSSFRCRITLKNISTSVSVIADVGSSMMIRSALREIALAIE